MYGKIRSFPNTEQFLIFFCYYVYMCKVLKEKKKNPREKKLFKFSILLFSHKEKHNRTVRGSCEDKGEEHRKRS